MKCGGDQTPSRFRHHQRSRGRIEVVPGSIGVPTRRNPIETDPDVQLQPGADLDVVLHEHAELVVAPLHGRPRGMPSGLGRKSQQEIGEGIAGKETGVSPRARHGPEGPQVRSVPDGVVVSQLPAVDARTIAEVVTDAIEVVHRLVGGAEPGTDGVNRVDTDKGKGVERRAGGGVAAQVDPERVDEQGRGMLGPVVLVAAEQTEPELIDEAGSEDMGIEDVEDVVQVPEMVLAGGGMPRSQPAGGSAMTCFPEVPLGMHDAEGVLVEDALVEAVDPLLVGSLSVSLELEILLRNIRIADV